jgi:hypothetical protein
MKVAPEVQYRQSKTKADANLSQRVKDNYKKDIFWEPLPAVNSTRAENIENYLGSSGVRDAVLRKDSHKQGLPDKIVNTHIDNLNNIHAITEKPKHLKTAKHVLFGSQVVYQ